MCLELELNISTRHACSFKISPILKHSNNVLRFFANCVVKVLLIFYRVYCRAWKDVWKNFDCIVFQGRRPIRLPFNVRQKRIHRPLMSNFNCNQNKTVITSGLYLLKYTVKSFPTRYYIS